MVTEMKLQLKVADVAYPTQTLSVLKSCFLAAVSWVHWFPSRLEEFLVPRFLVSYTLRVIYWIPERVDCRFHGAARVRSIRQVDESAEWLQPRLDLEQEVQLLDLRHLEEVM